MIGLTSHEEDVQYFREQARLPIIRSKREYSDRTARLLEEANHMVPVKVQVKTYSNCE